jgi:hypothetical protein
VTVARRSGVGFRHRAITVINTLRMLQKSCGAFQLVIAAVALILAVAVLVAVCGASSEADSTLVTGIGIFLANWRH